MHAACPAVMTGYVAIFLRGQQSQIRNPRIDGAGSVIRQQSQRWGKGNKSGHG
jgi:hypothetical protein